MKRRSFARWMPGLLVLASLGCPAPTPTTTPEPTPTAVTPSKPDAPRPAVDVFVAVSSRDQHSCAVRERGQVLCWGKNTYGQLGDGTREDRSQPVRVAGVDDAVEVAVGRGFSCARRRSGQVACWGDNQDGQLGDGKGGRPKIITPTAVAVFGLRDVAQLSAGDDFACARLRDGSVRCWGNAESGQLGSDSQRVFASPRTIPDVVGTVDLACGGAHVCAVDGRGKVLCWGRNTEGQLGDGQSGSRVRAVEVKGMLDAVDVASGANHSCVRRKGGPIACWGDNGSGQLGAGARHERKRHEPVAVAGLSQIVALAGGGNHSCALGHNGRVSCWGGNEAGQLGTSASAPHESPHVIRHLEHATALALGAHHGCAARSDGDVVCWGSNEHGALGSRPLH
ncbi:MAG: hypothetical protein K1X88_18225 [Nannocystaceae bacterium]|nr:hypothetical protein [Nannocystaceae bacterium]